MRELERLRRFADAEILARWRKLREADPRTLDRDSRIRAAWHGRQLDQRWAAGVAAEVLDATAGAARSDVDAALARGYALLVLGESEALRGDLAPAAARAEEADAL
ncbi:MAG: hypothetical protein KGL18_19205, partial [Burkholderiales bacterium]|nr:hypothetical protein [Burkholderiales bacterium]